MQARSALGDFAAADGHAAAAERLAERHERPLVGVFTAWFRALRLAASGEDASGEDVEAAYREAVDRLDGSGMPGFQDGLPSLALLCSRVRAGRPAPTGPADWGPYEPWARPLVLLARGERDAAAEALRETPEPPADLLLEALWALTARAAVELGDRAAMRRAHDRLRPAAGELAGAGSGLVTLGPVSHFLDELDAALAR